MALGIPVSTYSSHERAEAPGGRDYSPEQAQRYARRFGVTAEWLLFGPPETAKKPTTTKRTIAGYIGLNGEVFFYAVAPENLEQVEIPELVTASTVAFEIRGRSMGAYLRGWHLLFDDDRLPPTPDLVGKLCVVTLKDGRVLIRQLQKGEAEGRFDLISEAGHTIRNPDIVWAAKVKDLVQPLRDKPPRSSAAAGNRSGLTMEKVRADWLARLSARK
jgi:hypothetical protein